MSKSPIKFLEELCRVGGPYQFFYSTKNAFAYKRDSAELRFVYTQDTLESWNPNDMIGFGEDGLGVGGGHFHEEGTFPVWVVREAFFGSDYYFGVYKEETVDLIIKTAFNKAKAREFLNWSDEVGLSEHLRIYETP